MLGCITHLLIKSKNVVVVVVWYVKTSVFELSSLL